MHVTRQLISLVFPPQCCVCDRQILEDASNWAHRDSATEPRSLLTDHFCSACWISLPGDQIHRCRKCGATTSGRMSSPANCYLCRGALNGIERAIAIGNYRGPLQKAVIRMKRERNDALAYQFGRWLGIRLIQMGLSRKLDAVVPVPIHWSRRLKRGFHAAELLAHGIRQTTRLPQLGSVLRCLRATKKQGLLSNAGRFANLRGAFGIKAPSAVIGLRILVVDDVMTSGATVSQAAKVLRTAGAESVFVAVVARGARVS
jgi:ComF family protein